ncbi:hypothetical protein SteCoe_12264 [Stentor coeruleus]|uniref:Uncharacterized protein n=1 Tax=Stentor coeruleus TaxID=5963 RepID=A0A1R2CBA1_9CILI|nr:hypothetical protein SteCoe_12264 [Stentor coeruleus]
MDLSFNAKKRLELKDLESHKTKTGAIKLSNLSEYEEKLNYLKETYEQRIESITAFAYKFYEIAQTDEALLTMQGNKVSEKYANHRLRELFEETMLKESEFTINQLQKELASQKALVSKLEIEKSSLEISMKKAEDISKKQEQYTKFMERENLKSKDKNFYLKPDFSDPAIGKNNEPINKSPLHTNFESSQQEQIEYQNFLLEKERNYNKTLENEIKNLKSFTHNTKTQENIHELYHKSKQEISHLNAKIQELEQSYNTLQKKSKNYQNQLKTILSADQKSTNEALNLLKEKYKTRSKMFKKKIIEQKQIIETLDQEVKNQKQIIDDNRKIYNNPESLNKIKAEYESKCNDIQKKYQIQILSLQNQYQKLLEERVEDIQKDAFQGRMIGRDIEIRGMLEERAKDYVTRAEYEDLNKEKEKIMRNCEKFASQTEDFEKKFNKIVEERAIVESILEKERIRVRELLMENEEIKKHLRNEGKNQVAIGFIADYKEILTQKDQDIEELNKKIIDFQMKMTSLGMDLQSEKAKTALLNSKFQETKTQLDVVVSSKNDIENHLIICRSQLEKIKIKSENMESLDDDWKNQLGQMEKKFSQAMNDNSESQRKLKELKNIAKNKDNEISQLKYKIIEYDKEITNERITSNELIKKIDSLNKRNYLKYEILSKLKNETNELKSKLKKIKTFIIEIIQEIKKDNSSAIQDLLFRFLDSNNNMRKQMEIRYQAINDEINDGWIKKIQNFEENTSKNTNLTSLHYQEKLQNQDIIINEMKNYLQFAKKQQKSISEELEKYKKKIIELHEKIANSEKEKKLLENSLKKNSESFDSLQAEIKKEITKLQCNHQVSLEKLKRELENKHNNEMKEFLEKYRNKSPQGDSRNKGKGKKSDKNTDDGFLIKKKHKELLDKANNDLQKEKEKNMMMREKLRRIEEEIVGLKDEHVKTTSEFEERVNFLDKHSKMEIEVLQSQLLHAKTACEIMNIY